MMKPLMNLRRKKTKKWKSTSENQSRLLKSREAGTNGLEETSPLHRSRDSNRELKRQMIGEIRKFKSLSSSVMMLKCEVL
jgi:hypothetical protein